MKLLRRRLTQALLGISLLTPAWAEPAGLLKGEYGIPNLGAGKIYVREYVKSGQYQQEVSAVAKQAQEFLSKRLEKPVQGKPAIVFDIDETCLSNYPHIEEMDFGFLPKEWNLWIDKAQAPALDGCLELYKFARSKGVAVIFITGRNSNQKTQTENNLRQQGFSDWQELILKPAGSHQPSAIFKTEHRKRLSESGLDILVNIGDQNSDIVGGYSEAVFKLPNPMYWVP